MHSRHDARVTSEPGRRASAAALRERLLNDVDPTRELDEEERERRYSAYRAHFQGIRAIGIKKQKREQARQRRAFEAEAGGAIDL